MEKTGKLKVYDVWTYCSEPPDWDDGFGRKCYKANECAEPKSPLVNEYGATHIGRVLAVNKTHAKSIAIRKLGVNKEPVLEHTNKIDLTKPVTVQKKMVGVEPKTAPATKEYCVAVNGRLALFSSELVADNVRNFINKILVDYNDAVFALNNQISDLVNKSDKPDVALEVVYLRQIILEYKNQDLIAQMKCWSSS